MGGSFARAFRLGSDVMLGALAAFFAAALSGMGVGGGGLFLIYLTLAADVPQHTAQLVNLCFFMIASASSLAVHIQKRKLPFCVILLLAVGGALGAFFGVLVAANTHPNALRVILGAFFAVSGAVSLFKKKPDGEK